MTTIEARCQSYKFNTYFALKQNGGIPINRGRPTPLNNCIAVCKRYSACAAVSWDFEAHTCTWHNLVLGEDRADVTADKCCVHLRKVCALESVGDSPNGGQLPPDMQPLTFRNQYGRQGPRRRHVYRKSFPTSPHKPPSGTGNDETTTTEGPSPTDPTLPSTTSGKGSGARFQTTRPSLDHIFRSTSGAPLITSSTTREEVENVTSGENGTTESEATLMPTMEPTTIPSFVGIQRIPDSGKYSKDTSNSIE